MVKYQFLLQMKLLWSGPQVGPFIVFLTYERMFSNDKSSQLGNVVNNLYADDTIIFRSDDS